MNILNKLNIINNELLNESGIGNLKELAKDKKGAWLYFHQDLDGIVSGICMKEYLKQNGIKVVKVDNIQYGDAEYAINKVPDDMLFVIVDFAHGKVGASIHTDHHDKQAGVESSTLSKFAKSPSNASYISTTISPRDIFPSDDLKYIDMVDSANFIPYGVTPEDLVRASFDMNPNIDVQSNKKYLALVVNKLALTFKSKPEFLSDLVMQSKPSLISMYNTLIKLIKERGYASALEIKKNQDAYTEVQSKKSKGDNINDISTLKNGEYITLEDGKVIVQYGGGSMTKVGSYDRYTPYKLNPNADFLVIMWPLGLMQISMNPFKPKMFPNLHLGNLAKDVLESKFKSKFEAINVTLETIKRTFEQGIKDNTSEKMGFNFSDLLALFEGKIKGLEGKETWKQLVADITNKKYANLTYKQKDILSKVTISLWDIVEAQSGGHAAITNLSGINFAGKGYTDLMRDLAKECTKILIQKMKS